MKLSDEFAEAIDAIEAAGVHEATLKTIFAWEMPRPAQRVAALVIASMAFVDGVHPRADDLARILGIDIARAEGIFDGMEHPPYALTRVEPDRYERFVPTQTLEYGSPVEG